MQGDKILTTIHALEQKGVKFNHVKTKQGRNQYITEGSDYILEFTIDPNEWLGLVFVWHYNDHTKSLEYSIDTDLYPISKPEHHEFAQEIEADMIQFLAALSDNKILVGHIKNKPAIAIPFDGGFYTVIKRLLGATGRAWTNDEFGKLQKDLKPLKFR